MFKAFSFINFLVDSKNQYSVHSPFVFNLITKSLYKEIDKKEDWNTYLKIRKEFSRNNKKIEVTDFGAGSKQMLSNKRSVKSIAKKAGISKKRAKLLYKICNYLKPESILEIGTSVGLATFILSISNPDSKITTLEGCPKTSEVALEYFEKYDLENIKLITGEFKKTLPKVLKDNKYDFVFIDGNHTKEATISYFEKFINHTNNNSFFIFDDIYWSKEMSDAWNYIHNHPRVTVSIDTFQWGIVFFKKELQKQHFIIRV